MVKFTAAAVGAIVLLASGSTTTEAFTCGVGGPSHRGCRSIDGGEAMTRLSMSPLPTPEESAKALSDYMAKSHEEKLRAVKDAEAKSAAIIESLKNEIEELKSSRETSIVQAPAAPLPPPPEGSREELAAKLVSYQKFMSEYIVKAQEQKLAAVRAAEAAAEKKFQEKLLLLGAATEPPAAAAAAAPAAPAVAAVPSENKLFAERNAKVSAAAKAGKSRWGDMEIQRAAAGAAAASVSGAASAAAAPVAAAPAPPAAPAADVPVPPEVEAADHGLRADGGVGGPSLAERVNLGARLLQTGRAAPATVAAAPAPASAPAPAAPVGAAAPGASKTQAIFQQRNAMVSAAAKAGKSRWGEMETERAADFAARALSAAAKSTEAAPAVDAPVPPEVVAADHGLRADGGVGGLTLAQRVALGANANGATATAAANGAVAAAVTAPTLSKNQVLFQQRNAKVSAAGHAGKSRWGAMEIERATEYAANALPSADAPRTAVATGERVNLGAQLLQNA